MIFLYFMGSFLAFMGVVPSCGPRDFGMIWECPKIRKLPFDC